MVVRSHVQLTRRSVWSRGNQPTSISLRHTASLDLGDRVSLYAGVVIFGWGTGEIRIGEGTYLNPGTTVVAGADITIGSGCAIGWDVQIFSDDIHFAYGPKMSGSSRSPVTIGDNVWIGAKSTILKGTEIGRDSVVAAGSVVVGGLYPPNTLIAGNPARVIREGVNWRDLTREEKISKFGALDLTAESDESSIHYFESTTE